MPPAAGAGAGRLSRTVARLRRAWSWYLAYVRTTSVDVPQVRLPRRCGRAPRFGSAAYGVPPARLDLATASFLRCALGAAGAGPELAHRTSSYQPPFSDLNDSSFCYSASPLSEAECPTVDAPASTESCANRSKDL